VRRQLIEQKGYQEEELPSEETIRCRLNEMGYSLKRVVKAKPQKTAILILKTKEDKVLYVNKRTSV
jgi:hypothetical protein